MLPDVDLAPKGIGALLDDALALYRAHARSLLIASAVVIFPVALAMSIAQVFLLRGFASFISSGLLSGSPAPESAEQFFQSTVPIQAAYGIAGAAAQAYALVRWYMLAAVVTAAAPMLYGRRVEWRDLLKPGWRNVLTFVGVEIVIGLAVGALALLAFLVGAFTVVGLLVAWLPPAYVWARWSLAPAIVVSEGCTVGQGLRRSWMLTRGRFWRTLGFAISLALVAYAVTAAIQSPAVIRQVVSSIQNPQAIFQPLSVGWKVFEGVLAAIGVAIVVPFHALAWYRYYLDVRSRQEGMDLVVRANDLAANLPAQGSHA